jgi:hypothetical protein
LIGYRAEKKWRLNSATYQSDPDACAKDNRLRSDGAHFFQTASSRSNHTAHDAGASSWGACPRQHLLRLPPRSGYRVRATATLREWKVLAVGNGQEMAATRPHSLTQFGFHQPMQGVLRVGPAFENRDNPDVKGSKGAIYPEVTAGYSHFRNEWNVTCQSPR